MAADDSKMACTDDSNFKSILPKVLDTTVCVLLWLCNERLATCGGRITPESTETAAIGLAFSARGGGKQSLQNSAKPKISFKSTSPKPKSN